MYIHHINIIVMDSQDLNYQADFMQVIHRVMVKVIATCVPIAQVESHYGLQYCNSTLNKMQKLIPHLCSNMTCWLLV